MGEHKIIDLAGMFATVVGTFKVVGILSGVWIFTYLGQTLAIAPAPSPYDRVSTLDPTNPYIGMAFSCENPEAATTWHRWDYMVRGAIPGPHRRGVTLLSYFGNLSRVRTGAEHSRLDELTRYYFCQDGPIAKAAGCDMPISAVLFRNFNANPSADPVARVLCSP